MKTLILSILTFFLLGGSLWATNAVTVPSEPPRSFRVGDEQFHCFDPRGLRTGYRHVYDEPSVVVYGWMEGERHLPPVAFVYFDAQENFLRFVLVLGPTRAVEYSEAEARGAFADACDFPFIRAVDT